MIYRRRATPLHAARAAVGCAYCAALALAALTLDHPLALAAVLAAVLAAAALAGVLRELRPTARVAITLALLLALINPIVSREGVTVIVRGGDVPWLGALDITLEAAVYGGVVGLRALVVLLCFGLYGVAVDPDEVLRLFRRVSFRSALTATLATRMVPVLARDARRVSEAQRSRTGWEEPSMAQRLQLTRAVATGALDRAVDVAATLEVRGYGTARRPPRPARRPWSRHDLGFTAAAVAMAILSFAGPAVGAGGFDAYPRLAADGILETSLLSVLLVVCALLPFADRRGIQR